MAEYLTYDERGLKELRCMMGCGAILSQRVETQERTHDAIIIREKVVQQSHARTYRVELEDGSYQNFLVCTDCLSKCSEADFPALEATARWGWKEDTKFHKKLSDLDAAAEVAGFAHRKKIIKHLKSF